MSSKFCFAPSSLKPVLTFRSQTDGTRSWFLRPHEIIALLLTLSVLIYFVFWRDVSSWADNLWAYGSVLSFSFLVLPSHSLCLSSLPFPPNFTSNSFPWHIILHFIVSFGFRHATPVRVFGVRTESFLRLTFLPSGLIAASFMFLTFCATEMRDTGFMRRPHPVVWRVIKGIAILYLLGCVLLVFQARFFPRLSSSPSHSQCVEP